MTSRSPLRHCSGAAMRLLCLILAGGAAAGCATKPYLSNGDANSAEVGYGGDLAAATAVAKDHCARYERVPRFLDAEDNIAYFDCERP
jgi:hypothetical protein